MIKSRIQCFMQLDDHVSESGCYNVRSLYFDDIFNTGYHANEDGTEPREKFRIRVYDNDASCILLEKKQKRRGITIKDACLLTMDQAEALIRGKRGRVQERFPAAAQRVPHAKQAAKALPRCDRRL